jgi:hypothetical protein
MPEPSSDPSPIRALTRWEGAVVIFLLAALSWMFFARRGFEPEVGGGGEAYALALSLAEHGTYANPFVSAGPTGPSAHMAPLYPMFLASLIRIFGSNMAAVGNFLLVAAFGLHAALLPLASQALFGSAFPGAFASLLCICAPLYRVTPAWDSMDTAAGLIVYCVISNRVIGSACARWFQAAGLGLFAAGLFLMNPVSALVFIPWTVFVLARNGGRVKTPLACAAAIAFAIAWAPWAIRNYAVFHAFVPARDDLGIALYSSNNDCAQPTLAGNLASGCHERMHPIGNIEETSLVRSMGEVAYNRYRQAQALTWIRLHRAAFAQLTWWRAVAFWFPRHDYGIWLITLLSAPGIVAIRRANARWFVLAVFALYPMVYYVVEANSRYRYPILWVTLLCAGYALWQVAQRLFPRFRWDDEGRPGHTPGARLDCN